MGNHEHRALQIVRDHLAPPRPVVGLDVLRRFVNLDRASAASVRFLANRVGGLEALEALDAVPIPDEPFDWSVVAEADRAFVATVLELVEGVARRRLDAEYITIARRLLARVLVIDAGPIRRSSRAERIAAGLVHAVLAGNDELGRAGRWRAADVATWFGASSAGTVARSLVAAAHFELPYDDPSEAGSSDVRLPATELLHSRVRQKLLEWRAVAVEICERDEVRRAGRRPMVDLGDGRVELRSCLSEVAFVHKGLGVNGQIMMVLAVAPLVPEPELELFALSVPEAHRLKGLLDTALVERPPRPDLLHVATPLVDQDDCW